MTYWRVSFWLVLLVTLSLSSSIPNETAAADAQTSAAPLTIAIDANYPPFSVVSPTGEATGLLVEMWRLWSETTGMPIIFRWSNWSGTLDALRDGSADIHFGLFESARRAERMLFSEPIHEIKTALFFTADGPPPKPLEEMAGKRIGAIDGFYHLQYLKDNYPDIQPVAYRDSRDLVLGLLKGEIDAILNEVPATDAALAHFGLRGLFVRGTDIAFSNQVVGAVLKGRNELLQKINEGFRAIPTERLAALEARWLQDLDSRFYVGGEGIELTQDEEAWLDAHPVIRLAVTDFIRPVDIMDKIGHYSGLNADLIQLLNRKLGTNIVPEFHQNWADVVSRTMKGELDGAFSLSRTPERERSLLFTKPYAFDPIVIVVDKDDDRIGSWPDLRGKSVVVAKGMAVTDEIRRQIGDTGRLTVAEDDLSALESLLAGQAEAYAGFLIPYGNARRSLGRVHFRIALTRNTESGSLRIGVPKNRPEFYSIVRKGLNAISREEIIAVRNKWLFPKDTNTADTTELTADERVWLHGHPIIRLAVLKDWPPFDLINDEGQHIGLHSDLLRLIDRHLGVNVVTIPFDTWEEAYATAAAGEVDGIMSLSWSKEREKVFLYSTPYHYDPAEIVVRADEGNIKSWQDLSGKTVLGRSDSVLVAKIKNELPTAVVVEIETEKAALEALAAGEGDVFVDFISVNKTFLDARGLKVSTTVDMKQGELSIGVHRSNPALAGIVQKGLNTVTAEEMADIRNKWLFAETDGLEFSAKERAWIAEHPTVIVANEMDWPPFDFAENGEAKGLTIDLVRRIAEKTGITVEFINGYTWAELVGKFKAGEIDVLPAVYFTSERQKYMAYTSSYATNPSVLVTRDERTEISGLEDLAGKKVAVISSFVTAEVMKSRFPDIEQVPVGNVHEGLKAVSLKHADAFVGSIGVISHILDTSFIPNIRIVGEVWLQKREETKLHLGVLRENEALRNILQKGLDAITRDEMRDLRRNWIPFAVMAETDKIPLTPEERDWLNAHKTISMGVDPAYPPFDIVDTKGRYRGMTADYIRLVNDRLGIEMRAVPDLTWAQVEEGLKKGEIDLAPALTETPDRRRYLRFTRPYISFPTAIVTRTDGEPAESLENFAGKKLALVKGYYYVDHIVTNHPEIEPLFVETPLEAIKAVSFGKAEGLIENLAVVSYLIAEHNVTNLRLDAEADIQSKGLAIGVRQDWPMFVDILNKALDSITEEEGRALKSRWIPSATIADADKVKLTAEEHDWLNAHKTIRLGDDFAWPPFTFMDEDGRFAGIAAGYSEVVSERLGIELKPVTGLSWKQVLEKMKAGEMDVLPAVARTEAREKFLHFTEPYISFPIVVATRKDGVFVDNLGDLAGLKVGVVEGYVTQEILTKDFPKLVLVTTGSLAQGLQDLDDRKIDAFVDNLGSITYEMDKQQLEDIKIAAPTDYRFDLSFGVRKDWPQLAQLLDKALETIDERERAAIKNTWMAVEVKFGLDMKTILIWAVPIGGAAILIIAVIVMWNRRLGREVKERKRAQAKETEALEAVLASEERFRGFAEVASDWYWEMDADLRYTYVSPAYERIVGRPPDALIGRTRREMYKGNIPGERDAWMAFLDTLDHHQDFEEFTYTYNRPSGERLVLSNNGRAMFGKSGEFRGYRGSGNDITERKEAERELSNAFGVITESIDYAAHIQQSLLPPDAFFAEDMADHFIIWEPRDVVGGDIYWYRRCEGGFLVVLADCTGHGVPGAFMTIIATGALDRALRDQPDGDPATILKIMNRSVKRSLGQDGKEGASDDGLELGICKVVPDARRLVFAGARFSLFHSVGDDLVETKGDKSAIGYRHVEVDQEYSNREMMITDGQRFYMVSDGLIDQIGGDRHRMFGKKRFKELVVSGWDLPFAEQKVQILDALTEYQGNESRRDDLSVVGFTMT